MFTIYFELRFVCIYLWSTTQLIYAHLPPHMCLEQLKGLPESHQILTVPCLKKRHTFKKKKKNARTLFKCPVLLALPTSCSAHGLSQTCQWQYEGCLCTDLSKDPYILFPDPDFSPLLLHCHKKKNFGASAKCCGVLLLVWNRSDLCNIWYYQINEA